MSDENLDQEVAQESPVVEETPVVQLGTKEIREVLAFAIALGKGVESSLADDKFTLTDIPNFLPAFMKLIPAISDLDKAKLEILSASSAEIDELKAYIKEELDLESDKLEELVNASLAVVFDIWLLIDKFFIKKY